MRYFVTPRSAVFCIVGLLCAFIALVSLRHTDYTRAVPLLVIAGVALYAANRISKRALHDY
jgi:hypothetical protein